MLLFPPEMGLLGLNASVLVAKGTSSVLCVNVKRAKRIFGVNFSELRAAPIRQNCDSCSTSTSTLRPNTSLIQVRKLARKDGHPWKPFVEAGVIVKLDSLQCGSAIP